MQMILNELSAKFPVASIEKGRSIMKEFLVTYQKMKKIIHNDQVLLDKDYQGIYLADGYNIAKWRNDNLVDEETKRLFRILLNRSDTYDKVLYSESEFICVDKSSIGCLIAYETNNCVISFLSDTYWESSKIQGRYVYLDENDSTLLEEDVEIPNVSNSNNIQDFDKEFGPICEQELRYSFRTGSDILAKQEELFPNLVLCKNAEKQLKYENDTININQISRKLLELQNYFSRVDNVFDKNQLNNATPESSETLKAYSEEHTFELPNGEKRIFSWHIRFTGKYAGRIFFEPDAPNKKCYIGHIGGKLKTVRYH